MARFTYSVERTIVCVSDPFGHASDIDGFLDDHDHIHSMVMQSLISGNMLTCQFLTLLGAMVTHMYRIFILFSCKRQMLLHHWISRTSLGDPNCMCTAY